MNSSICFYEFQFPGWQNQIQQLDNNYVHIHLLPVENIEIDGYMSLLSYDEIEKSRRFRNQEDAKLFLAGKIFTKKLLAFYNAVSTEEIKLIKEKNGKPVLPAGIYMPVRHFNISHTRDMLALAFSKTPVGIDIERFKEIDYHAIIKDIYTDAEKANLNNATDPVLQFYKIWTRKESYLKATGSGITNNLQQIDVSEVIDTSAMETSCNHYSFYTATVTIDEEWVCSICNESAKLPALMFFKNTSLLSL